MILKRPAFSLLRASVYYRRMFVVYAAFILAVVTLSALFLTAYFGNALEQEILACRDDLAAEVLGKASDATLREIIAGLQPQESEELEQLRVKLFGFAEEIRRINQTNYLLLKQSIELLDEVVSSIIGEAPCNTYEGSGRMQTDTVRPSTLSVEA